MDIDFKAVMIAVGAFLILTVLIHGAVHAWREHRRKHYVKPKSASDQMTREEVNDILIGDDIIGGPRPAKSANIDVPVLDPTSSKTKETEDSSSATPGSKVTAEVRRDSMNRSRKPPRSQAKVKKFEVGRRKKKRQEAAEAIDPDEIIFLHVLGSSGSSIGGQQIKQLMYEHKLKFEHVNGKSVDEGWIFRAVDPETEELKFQVGQSQYPGTFPNNLDSLSTEGLALMMRLDSNSDSLLNTFDEMLDLANAATQRLSGRLVDDDRNRMTDQTTAHLRRRVAEVSRKQLMSAV